MRCRIIICAIFALTAGLVLSPREALADRVFTGFEIWAGAGALDADYHDEVIASAKAGAGLRFYNLIAAGGAVQFDKDHSFALAYVGVHPMRDWFLKPFGRLELGARTDMTDEAAVGYTIGVEMGEPTMNVFLAYSGITRPGSVDAVHFGFIFNSLNR